MASVSFDTPKVGSTYDVQTTGTVDAHATAHVTIKISVTNTSSGHPRNDIFLRVIDIPNTTYTPAAFHGTYSLTIIPKLFGSDTVQVLPPSVSY